MSTNKGDAPKKKPAAKKPASKKPAAKKPAAKKKVEVKLEDPSELKPIIYRSKFAVNSADRTKTLSKMTVNVRKSIEIIGERSDKRPVKLFTPAMLRRALIPYNEIYFQYMLNCIGFRTPMAIEIVAQEKVGATTFVMDWMGNLLDMGCYSVYIECENKQMDDKRIKRLMDRDPSIATLKMNAIEWASARSLAECDNTIRKTVTDLRKRCDADPMTKGNPIFVFIDPWGSLMSKAEAKGNSTWGLAASAAPEVAKDTTDGSNFEHAKHAQGVARWLPAFMEKFNCMVVFVNKQNDKVDMNAKPGFGQPSPMKNDTRIGGRALKRLCAYRMTMLKLDDLRKKEGNKKGAVYGHNNRIMLVANSYGPRDRQCEFSILFDDHEDEPDFQAPGLTFDERTALWMAERKLLGISVKGGRFTCDAAGCVAVTSAELMAALKANPDHLAYVGSRLGIEGYDGHEIVDKIAETQPEDEEDLEEEADFEMLVPDDEVTGEEVPDA